jgi:hypothetical protein
MPQDWRFVLSAPRKTRWRGALWQWREPSSWSVGYGVHSRAPERAAATKVAHAYDELGLDPLRCPLAQGRDRRSVRDQPCYALVKSVPVHRLEGEECATGEAQPLVLVTPSNAIGAPLRLPGAPINV